MKLGEWLQLRKIKAAHFARVVGAHESAIARLISGDRSPSFVMCRAIAKATEGEVGLWDWPEPKAGKSKRVAARA